MSRAEPTELTWTGGSIVFDALVSETPAYEADVPTAPTAEGYVAVDCTRKSATLKLEVAVTERGLYRPSLPGHVGAVRDQLLRLQSAGTELTVTTPGGDYPSMLLKSVGWTHEGLATTAVFTLGFVERRVATMRTVNGLPAPKTKVKAPETQGKVADPSKTAPAKASLLLSSDNSLVSGLRGALGVAGAQ